MEKSKAPASPKEGGFQSLTTSGIYEPVRFAFTVSHIAGFSMLFGGAVFRNLVPSGILWLTVISGLLLVALESFAFGLHRLIVMKSAFTLLKTITLVFLQFFPYRRAVILGIAMILGISSTHLPQKIREIRIDVLLTNSGFLIRSRWKRFLKEKSRRN
jgi:hypothetical protein